MDARKRTVSFYAAGAAAYDYDVLKEAAERDNESVSKKISRGMELAALEEKLGIKLSAGVMFAIAAGQFQDLRKISIDGRRSMIVVDGDAYAKDKELSKDVREWCDRGKQ